MMMANSATAGGNRDGTLLDQPYQHIPITFCGHGRGGYVRVEQTLPWKY